LNNSRRSSLASSNGSGEPIELRRIGTDDELFSRTKTGRGTLRRSTLDCSGLRNQSCHSLPETSTTNRRSTIMDMTMGFKKMKEDEKVGTNGKINFENHVHHSSLVKKASRSTTANVRTLNICNMMEKQMSLRSLEDGDQQVEEQQEQNQGTKTRIRDLDATFHSLEEQYSLKVDNATLDFLIKDVELHVRMKRKS
jgi:hypothetical protein